jgi:hypothetical protein
LQNTVCRQHRFALDWLKVSRGGVIDFAAAMAFEREAHWIESV